MDNTPSLSDRLALKVSEAAALTGLSTSSIRRAIARGQLKVCRRFRHVLIPRDELKRFLEVASS